MSSVTRITEPMFCEYCNGKVLAGYYFCTKDDRWTGGCKKHYRMHRKYPVLGTDKGQRLVLFELVKG